MQKHGVMTLGAKVVKLPQGMSQPLYTMVKTFIVGPNKNNVSGGFLESADMLAKVRGGAEEAQQ
jgi:hypothetical protein